RGGGEKEWWRRGNRPGTVPAGVEVTVGASEVSVKGPLGVLKQPVSPAVVVKRDGDKVTVELQEQSIQADAMSGTLRALIANMVQGVSKGFERRLTLVGVGYRAQAQGDKLNLSLGFSHPVVHQM